MNQYNQKFRKRQMKKSFRESENFELRNKFSLKLSNSLLDYDELKNIIAWVDLICSYIPGDLIRKMYPYGYGLNEEVAEYCKGMNWSPKEIDPEFGIDDIFYQMMKKVEVTYFAADDEVIKLNMTSSHTCQYINSVGGEFDDRLPKETEKVTVPHAFEFVWRDVPKL